MPIQQTAVATKTTGITGTKLMVATLAMLAAGGAALAMMPAANKKAYSTTYSPPIMKITCTDSDNGNPYIAGTANDIYGQTGVDECLKEDTLREYSCGYTSSTEIGRLGPEVIGSNIECSQGCQEGACVETTAATGGFSISGFGGALSCNDSDGGATIETRGTVTLRDLDTPSTTLSVKTDTCETGTSVHEYACKDESTPVEGVLDCKGGTCVDGACVASP